MAIIDNKVVKHIADLIKIHLNTSEIGLYKSNLTTVIASINTLSELDTKDIEITAQTIGTENIVRDDEVFPGLTQAQALSNASNFRDGYFVVKKVFRDE